MSSLFGQKRCRPTLDCLPTEIRLLILEALVKDGCTLSRLATVSRAWQAEIEQCNFARINLTPSRLVDFGSMAHRNRALVKYIWFCLELEDCDSPPGRRMDGKTVKRHAMVDTNNGPIATAFEDLFSVLSTWDPNGQLTLDVSIYSHSDSKHWVKNLTYMPGIPSATMRKIFHAIMDEDPFDSEQLELQWWDQLPSVPVVTKLLLRQQNRRGWKPDALAHMFARFPRLEELRYEPWMEWDSMRRDTDRRFRYLFNSIQRSSLNLKRLAIFENFNPLSPAFHKRFMDGAYRSGDDNIRLPNPVVSQMIAFASLTLEHLAASFIVDASQFFKIKPSWEWLNLTSLALTLKLLTPDESLMKIEAMLQVAATAAIKMPQLETMAIWNGIKGLAALFKFQASRSTQHATITWRGTWDFTLNPSTIQAWEAVINHQYSGCRLSLVQERLSEADIESHGDAIHYLKLSSQVVWPIPLRQIRR
ncbi:hypothetical protein MKX08_007169 [Trichoderma sp. CBMAI-0020]|nr:hypothetical protein MKX08_007169 [Trichoderma sp. CBMAI-0020]WOD46610.1 hypothetical protein [Trichoderma atroviride]